MRNLPVIRSAWESGGPYIGDLKPVTRVTIQKPWPGLAGTNRELNFLRTTTSAGIGSSKHRGVPMRWWQRKDNSQGEKEVPNIASVGIERSIDQDAGTFRIVLDNTWMYVNGTAPASAELGQPGYFVHDYGDTPEAGARWGHMQNEWHNYFMPNGLIRIFTGFGGDYPTTIPDAVTAGNQALYFVGLIDDVSVSTDGKITISGRDMAKLLIDQQLFPPLVPDSKYPLSYYRWDPRAFNVKNADKVVPIEVASTTTPGRKTTTYYDSSLDRWYGSNYSVYGHKGSDSVDGNPASYALGPGNSGPDKPFATDWWEYTVNDEMNGVFLHPWAGGYTMYVSVMVGGAWQGSETIPYDASHLFATQSPAVDTGANIPYVASFSGIPWETAREYALPASYNAERVRISFRNLAYSGLGQWKYRAGVREFAAVGLASETDGSTTGLVSTYIQAAGGRYLPTKSYSFGYVTASRFHQLDAFGDARELTKTHADHTFNNFLNTPGAVRFARNGQGYYVMKTGGSIDAYGAATWYGSPYTTDGFSPGNAPAEGGGGTDDGFCWDMAVTASGAGYWVISAWDTQVYSFGDATDHGPALTQPQGHSFTSIDSHPSADGYWVLRIDGRVFNRGAATHFGNIPTSGPNALHYEIAEGTGLSVFIGRSEQAVCLRATSTGQGYWILTSMGRVMAFGDAVHHGQSNPLRNHSENLFAQQYWELIPGLDDKGYLLVHADGTVVPCGEVDYFGSAVPGSKGEKRYDGNYKDYCLDEETEILSRDGWKTWVDLREGDQILGVDPETDGPVWQPVEHIYRKHRTDREMARMRGTAFDSLTTPDHRWLVKFGEEKSRWRWTTSDALKTTDYIPMSIPRSTAHLPLDRTHKDEFVELVAWFWTEGWWTSHAAALAQSSVVNPVNTERIRSLLRNLYGEPGKMARGATRSVTQKALWNERTKAETGVITFSLSKVVADRLREFVNQDKTVHWEFLDQLTLDQLDLFIEVSVDADGSRNPDGSAMCLSQVKLDRLESFEYACILAGRPISRKKTPQRASWTVRLHKQGFQNPVRSASVKGRMTITRERYTGTVWCPTVEYGNFIARRNGSIYLTGNSGIWKDLLRWSGFLLYDPNHSANQAAPTYAGIETTGAFAKERLPDEIFDKKPVIDAITEIREVVGYIFTVDHYGRPIIRSPNIWHFGNFNEAGTHTEDLLEVDEKRQLTQYAVSANDQDIRSKIIISSHDPYADLSGTVTTNYTPPSAPRLRGIVKPAMWINSFLSDPIEQRIMAELIGLHISFQERLGQVTCLTPPMLELDDQIRVYERQTGESNVHYVRGISFNHDLQTGNYLSTITTHWLGSGRGSGDVFGDIYPISDELQARIDSQQYGKYQVDPGSKIS